MLTLQSLASLHIKEGVEEWVYWRKLKILSYFQLDDIMSHFELTLDCWLLSVLSGYIAITIHLVNKDCNLYFAMLAFKYFLSEHNSTTASDIVNDLL